METAETVESGELLGRNTSDDNDDDDGWGRGGRAVGEKVLEEDEVEGEEDEMPLSSNPFDRGIRVLPPLQSLSLESSERLDEGDPGDAPGPDSEEPPAAGGNQSAGQQSQGGGPVTHGGRCRCCCLSRTSWWWW